MTLAVADRQIVMRSVDSLIPFANNARTHSDAQIAQLAASIREFGWTNPVLIDGENGIIAGHGRVLAARKLGQASVPCISLAGMSEMQKRAYIIADNRLALTAGWDYELLTLELDELKSSGFDVELTGFTSDDIVAFNADEEERKAPDEFGEYDENIETDHCCPKCGYRWSGKSNAGS